MSQVDKNVKVEQKTDDLMQHVAALLKAAKAAHAGGASWAQALPMDVAALVANLPAIVGDANQVGADLAESKTVFAKTVVMGAFDIADAVLA